MPDDPTPDDEIEQRLTAALEQRAAEVQPSAGDLAAIEAGVAAERARNKRRTALLAAAAVVLVVAGVVAFLNLTGDDGEDVFTDDPTTTTTEATTSTTTTTVPETTTTATTIPEDDDGVLGWPGAVARVFDNPESAALAFATDVLGFADATLAEGTTEGVDAEYVVHPRPTASVSTRIRLHDTGAIRGWVVTEATSDQGSIDEVVSLSSVQGGVGISGTATAFEATVSVFLLDLEGNVLAETFTMAGSNGEMGPYEATIGPAPSGTPHFVAIGAGDESGEGRLLWATLAPVP